MLSLLTAMPASRIQEVTCSWACRIASEAKGLVRRSGSSLHPPSTSQRSIAVAASRPTSDGFEGDVLRAFPQDELAERRKLLHAVLDGREMVARELAHLAREDSRPVREQDLGLAAPARLDDPRLEGEHRGEPGACFGCVLSLEPRLEHQAGNRYSHPGQFAIRI